MADAHAGAAAGARAFHVDRDRRRNAALHDGAAEGAVAAHLLGHGEGLKPVPRRLAGDEGGVALDRVEVDHVSIGGQRAA